MSFILTPSRSILFLGSKSLIILRSESGEVKPSSSSGGLGLGGIKASGCNEVGLIVSEIEVPIWLKNELNSSAISSGSELV